ncbi:MspA family porin [Nocardia sp. CA-119907]|uniref:MspA family porin n=1 Tax=Nocardia sp. CA-119907 TaxID=3239973 RepID=UPI003D969997
MRNHHRSFRRTGARPVVVVTAAVAAVGLYSAGGANADTFVPLPDGHTEGPGATIDSVGEQAVVSPSLAANGAGRTVWVSGRVTADVVTPHGEVGPNNGPKGDAGTNNSSTHGVSTLTVGYLVGCQVALGSLSASLSAAFSSAPSATGSFSVPLAPGQVKWVRFDQKDMADSGVYHLNYRDQEIAIQGCAGYAQARQVATVEIIGADYSKTTLYGQPFSIG